MEVTPLTIAADLADTMMRETQRHVAEETQTSIPFVQEIDEEVRHFQHP